MVLGVPLLAAAISISACGSARISTSAEKAYLHAEDFYVRGQTAAAVAIFTRISDKYPAFYQAGFMEAKSLYLLGHDERAERVLADLTADFPQYHEAQIWLARVQIERGEIDVADKLLARLLSFDSHDPRLLYLMALIRIDRNEFQEAITYLNEAEAGAGRLARIHLQLGRLYYRFGLDAKARSELGRTLDLIPAKDPMNEAVRKLLSQIPQKEHN